jgi:hypothetical protein
MVPDSRCPHASCRATRIRQQYLPGTLPDAISAPDTLPADAISAPCRRRPREARGAAQVFHSAPPKSRCLSAAAAWGECS